MSFNPMYNNYGNLYGQPISNPMVGYQERMAQLQQQYNMPQQMPQQYAQPINGLLGKIVDSLEVVKATDIPMDGNCYYFPKADGTEVYAKRWLASGATEVLVYKPVVQEENTQKEMETKTWYGEPLASTTMIITPAAVENYFNVSAAVYIDVPAGCCVTISVENTSTQSILVQNANLIANRVA